MKKEEIEVKWLKIGEFKSKRGYKALRVSAKCIPELYIAIDKDGSRSLMLYLPNSFQFTLKEQIKENLSLEYLIEKRIILLRLNNPNFTDIFNDLILSIIHKIEKVVDPTVYSQELISFFNKWAEFFNDSTGFRLTEMQIRGVFGELCYLKGLILKADSYSIDDLLESWKGPYETSNDFIFDDKNVEVKTKLHSKLIIYISSEYQLEEEKGKGLELLVTDLKLDLVNGQSLHSLLGAIVNIIMEKSGNLLIFYKALSQKSLSVENSKMYNNYRYVVIKSSSYNCLADGFPRLHKSCLADEIFNVKFSLNVSNLENYLITSIR